jgi:hypothetical protein
MYSSRTVSYLGKGVFNSETIGKNPTRKIKPKINPSFRKTVQRAPKILRIRGKAKKKSKSPCAKPEGRLKVLLSNRGIPHRGPEEHFKPQEAYRALRIGVAHPLDT